MPTYETGYASYLKLIIRITEDQVNIERNTSRVNVVLQLKSSSSTRVWDNNNQNRKITIDGAENNGSFRYDISNYGTATIGSFSREVAHNADGRKTISIAVNLSGSGGSSNFSTYLKLADIPRASKPTVSPSAVEVGQTARVEFNRAHQDLRHDLYFIFGRKTVTIGSKIVPAYADFTPTADLLNEIPDATSGWGTLRLDTFSGSTKTGEQTVKLTIKVPDNANYRPTASQPVVKEANPTILASGITSFVSGKSILDIQSNVSARGGASIRRVQFRIGSTEHEASLNGGVARLTLPLDKTIVGNRDVKMIVTDSRGRRTESSVTTFTALAYKSLDVSINVYRDEADSSKIIVESYAENTPLNGANKLTMKVFIWERGTNKPSTPFKIQETFGANINWTKSTWLNQSGNNFPSTSSYNIQVEVSDTITTRPIIALESVGSTKVLFTAYKDWGASIGKMYDKAVAGTFQVGGLMTVDGTMVLTGNDQDIKFIIDPFFGNAGIELGATKVKTSPYIDFHSSGHPNDRDVRLIAEGGVSGQSGSGKLNIEADAVSINSNPIVDTGTNANGTYIKYYDGTMICHGRIALNLPVNVANGNVFRSNERRQAFPATFVGPVATVVVNAYDAWVTLMERNPSVDFSFMLFKGTNTGSTFSTVVSWQAEGRWKA